MIDILLPEGGILAGTVGSKIRPFKPKCLGIDKDKQKWTVSPNLPDGLSLSEKDGVITGKLSDAYTKTHKLTVSNGKAKKCTTEFRVEILEPLPAKMVELVLTQAQDGSTIGHGICEFIDNSIDFDANRVDVSFGLEELEIPWDPNPDRVFFRPWIMVKDNGVGIGGKSEDGVGIEAIKKALGQATSPDEEYCMSRLGAFGIGLPAAALSSSKFCTVFSRNGESKAVGHMSLDDMKNHGSLRFFGLNDIGDWLKNSEAFTRAVNEFENMNKGTIVLIQDVYSIRRLIDKHNIENFHGWKNGMNSIMDQARNYLRLVYHNFLETDGVILHKSDSSTVNRKLNLYVRKKKQTPVDPLLKHQIGEKGQKGTLYKKVPNKECNIQNETRTFTIEMAVLPAKKSEGGIGRRDKNGDNHDSSIESALLMYTNPVPLAKGTEKSADYVTKVGVVNAQGLYFYRNFRLISFGSWRGLYAENTAGHQFARAAIHTPLGIPKEDVGGTVQNDFSVNSRKTKMNATQNALDEIAITVQKSRQWHSKDPSKTTLYSRGKKRSTWDGKKTPKKPKIHKAIIQPATVPAQYPGFRYEFSDQTQDLPKKITRTWKLNSSKISSEKSIEGTLDEVGEHIFLLDIKSPKGKKWQSVVKVEIIQRKKKKPPKTWKVVFDDSKGSEDIPIDVDKVSATYVINTNSIHFEKVIEDIEQGRGE